MFEPLDSALVEKIRKESEPRPMMRERLNLILVEKLIGRDAVAKAGDVDEFQLVVPQNSAGYIQAFKADKPVGPKFRMISTDEMSEQDAVLFAFQRMESGGRTFPESRDFPDPTLRATHHFPKPEFRTVSTEGGMSLGLLKAGDPDGPHPISIRPPVFKLSP